MRLKAFLKLCLLTGLPNMVNADELTDINRFLAAAEEQLDTLVAEGRQIPQQPGGLADWIDESQMRITVNDDFIAKSDTRHSYGLRVKPKAWGQRDAEHEILGLKAQLKNVHYRQALNTALGRRYGELLSLAAEARQVQAAQDLQGLAATQAQFNQSLVSTEMFNESGLLDAEILLEQTKDLAGLHQERFRQLHKKLHFSGNGQATDILVWLINLEQMQAVMAKVSDAMLTPEVQESRLALAEAKAEEKRKKTQQQFGVNLVRLQVDEGNNDPRIGLMLGINLPVGSDSYQNIQSRHDIYDAQAKLYDSEQAVQQDLAEKRDKMQWLVEEWQLAEKQIAQLQARLQKNYAQTNPKLALDLQMEYTKKQNGQIELQHKAMALYIDYLASAGQLTALPLRNWLHKDLVALPVPLSTAASSE